MENAPDDEDRRPLSQAEAETAAETEKSPERIGQMLMTASEKAPISHTGKSALEAVSRLAKGVERPAERPRASINKRIETLSRAELLNLSEQIIIDGSSLRQIYETHLIGERGLRRLISEHESGGDLKKALRHEISVREMDFERDPAMRDADHDVPKSTGSKNAKTDKAALDQLLEHAAASLEDTSEEAAFFKARALYEANQLQQHKQQRRWIDISLAVIIAVLFIMVIILLSR